MKIIINQDEDFVREMKSKIKRNNGYCPCQLQKNPNTKCMCKTFREQTENGFCHCGLYYKEIE